MVGAVHADINLLPAALRTIDPASVFPDTVLADTVLADTVLADTVLADTVLADTVLSDPGSRTQALGPGLSYLGLADPGLGPGATEATYASAGPA